MICTKFFTEFRYNSLVWFYILIILQMYFVLNEKLIDINLLFNFLS